MGSGHRNNYTLKTHQVNSCFLKKKKKEVLLTLEAASTMIFYMSLYYEILQFSTSPQVQTLLKFPISSATFCAGLDSQNHSAGTCTQTTKLAKIVW